MKKGAFKKRLLISFGIVLAALAGASAAFYFLSGDLHAQATQIIADKTAVAQQAAVVSTLANLKSDAVTASGYAPVIQKLLPSPDELIGFPQWVAAAGVAHNVQVSVMFQGENTTSTESAPGSDGFSLSAAGAEADLVAFLDAIETKTPGFLIAIDSFDMTNTGPNYELAAQGRVFSR